MTVLTALAMHAGERPDALAMSDGVAELRYGALQARVLAIAAWLSDLRCRRLGLLLDNGLDWALFDLAARQADIVVVPVPLFFSDEQVGHAITAAALDHVATDQPDRLAAIVGDHPASWTASPLMVRKATRLVTLARRKDGDPAPLPGRTRKITFTSGTTGRPKGVCLSNHAIDRVAASLLLASEGRAADRHLCLLPLATLLENIAGIYVPILAGAAACIPPLAEVGLVGSSQLDPRALVGALLRFEATTAVMVPQMLLALMAAAGPDGLRTAPLRLIAVGGAPLAIEALRRAERMGLPVRQGYGLSECASVVCFNAIRDNRPGSVGRPLRHVDVRLTPDGEILVRGAVCEGILGEPDRTPPLYWPTGDIGAFDADGYLHLLGRKKHMFITSFGRNVSPDWIECELSIEPAIAQAAVFGEARPWNAAVIVPRPSGRQAHDLALLAACVQRANARLPDYARVRCWIVADQAFTPENRLLTPNGRVRREAIAELYRDRLDRLYDEEVLRALS